MDAGIGEGAALLSIASAGFGASSKVMQGMGTQAADQAQADRLTRAAEFGKLQAAGTDATMRDELNITLGNIDAIRAAARIDPTSPTSAVIQQHEMDVSDRQRSATMLKIRSQTQEDIDSANYLDKAGDYALLQGFMGAAASVAGSVGKGLAGVPGGGGG